MRQFQCVPTTLVTEIKETYFEIYTKQCRVHWLSSFKHLKLPISRGVPEGKIKVRRGWVWEGVSPSYTLGKKNQNMN